MSNLMEGEFQCRSGNKKLFRKEMSNMKGGKMENCSRIKGRTGRPVMKEDDVEEVQKYGRSCII